MATPLSIIVLFPALSSLFTLAFPLPSESITDATEVLSNSGFVSMSLTLNLVYKTLIPSQIPSLTIFSPNDESFAQFGQPSLSLLQFHFSPHVLSIETLKSLPFGTKIPTMNANYSLVVTTVRPQRDNQVEINGVKTLGSPVFDDGYLTVFAIERFLDPDFHILAPVQSPTPSVMECEPQGYGDPKDFLGGSLFDEPCGVMRSEGYSVMASFLGLQLMRPNGSDHQTLTLFAPDDVAMVNHAVNCWLYPSIFLRHAVPCKLSASDLLEFNNGTSVQTHLQGFEIEITRVGNYSMLNGVAVVLPDLYQSEWLRVHGVADIIPDMGGGDIETEVSSESSRASDGF